MKIRLLFFAAIADRTGLRSKEIDVPDGSRIGHLGEFVLNEYPPLANLRLIYAVNQEYVSPNQLLNEGDEIAVFTPVSGG